MRRTLPAPHRLLPCTSLALALACSTSTANPNLDVGLSKSREGLPAEQRVIGRSSTVVGDTLICETHRQFRTADGNRWLWIRILRERQTERKEPDKTLAEVLVSTDAEGTQHQQKVELAGVSLDGEADYTLRNGTGVRTAEAKDSPRQAHRARGYTIGPNMGPVEVRCGSS
jgi:hypothetical protein